MKRYVNKITVSGLTGLVMLTAAGAYAGRTVLGRSDNSFTPAAPLSRNALATQSRGVVPTQIENGVFLTTEHFRVFWGNDFDRNDKEWGQNGEKGTPLWVVTLANSMEYALGEYNRMGFAPPYGVENYYIDIYVGNTGLRVYSDKTGKFEEIALFSDYYAFANINRDYGVAYFIFNDDFSAYSEDELPVLKTVAAHELFHAVQRAEGYPWDAENIEDGPEYIDAERWTDEGWWVEASATWMEEEIFPDVNDYTKYVSVFLAAPYQPLFTLNGLHEYGASIFAGYVRFMSEGLEALVGVMSDAYPLGVEEALRKNIGIYSGDSLEDAVTKFWSMAANPSGYWPDGGLYETDYAPKVADSVVRLPYSTSAPGGRAPGRFGANLFTLDTSVLPAPVTLNPKSAEGDMRFALVAGDSANARVANQDEILLAPPGGGGETAYGAVVNVSANGGPLDYKLTIGEKPGSAGGSGGGGGGCFLEALRR
ncbi:hypothetical protein EPN96_03395 [bacterium]|nr:MAG: hypothetical protein EPN96_03395 [bacterium]